MADSLSLSHTQSDPRRDFSLIFRVVVVVVVVVREDRHIMYSRSHRMSLCLCILLFFAIQSNSMTTTCDDEKRVECKKCRCCDANYCELRDTEQAYTAKKASSTTCKKYAKCMCHKMILTMKTFSARTGMLDSLCGHWDLYQLIPFGCFDLVRIHDRSILFTTTATSSWFAHRESHLPVQIASTCIRTHMRTVFGNIRKSEGNSNESSAS